jgi:hypothetical protein
MPLKEKEIIASRRESLVTTQGPWLCQSRRQGETADGLKEGGRCDLQIARSEVGRILAVDLSLWN